MNNSPLVSVVTPTYNQANFIRETLDSVLAQDYAHIEHLVIDDGSTDETPQILAEYTGRLEWESQPNMGQTPTINKGWQRSRGDILTWLNSDDTFLEGAVSKAVAYLQEHPEVDIIFGDTLFTEADGTPIERSKQLKEFSYEKYVTECENPIAQPSAFIRRAVIDDIGLLDPHYYFFMDWDFWLRAGLRHRIAYFPELLSTYRLHSESKSVSQAKRSAPELEYMYSNFFAREDLPEWVIKAKPRAMANMYFTTGAYYLKGMDRRAARRVARKAIKSYPQMLSSPAMLHKFAYCMWGDNGFYRKSRDLFHRARTPNTANRAPSMNT